MCEDCENALVINDFRFHVDSQLTERLARILIDKDPSDLLDLIDDVEARLDGVCFCSAYERGECICGSWED